jgi:hypothetical protein
MPTSENASVATVTAAQATQGAASVATASIVTTTHDNQSAAMEWAAPLPRTYFVGGHRVEHVRDSQGHSTWSCDCEEFMRAQQSAGDGACAHTQRISAAAELDKLLRTPGLILPTACY